MAGLIGVTPLSSYAASDSSFIQTVKSVVSVINQHKKGPGHKEKEHSENHRREQERKEKERREREQREKEKRERERREQERRERERREQEQRERERREQERREREHREQERRERERREQERNDARYIIHRTANVIYAAQRSTSRRNYCKGMSQAVAHQQKARQLFMAGAYQSAIHHSLRARRIAISIIEGNQERWANPWDTREEKYHRNSPRDNDLDLKLHFFKFGDQEAIKISIDLDLW